MPTTNPRINITVPPELYDTVGRLAALRGVSRSAVILEILEASHGAMLSAASRLEKAMKSVPEAEQVSAEVLSQAARRSVDSIASGEQVDFLTEPRRRGRKSR